MTKSIYSKKISKSTIGLARFRQATALMAVDNLVVKPIDDVLAQNVAQGRITERKAIALLKQRYAVNRFKRKSILHSAIRSSFNKHSALSLQTNELT